VGASDGNIIAAIITIDTEKAASKAAPRAMKITRKDKREHDPDDQHLLLVLGGDGEGGHDDHEDEQVVDRQALLDDVAGEVLAAEAPAGDRREDEPEADGDGDVEERPAHRLAEADLVRSRDGQRQIDRQ
jgi:hypothetical protein